MLTNYQLINKKISIYQYTIGIHQSETLWATVPYTLMELAFIIYPILIHFLYVIGMDAQFQSTAQYTVFVFDD
jgi:hypothetical protein